MENYISTKIGYGNPKGDFWFIGPEEGGSISSLNQRIAIWNQLGKNQHFHDLKSFHLEFKHGTEQFFEGKVKLQNTWNGIIEILFGILGKEVSVEEKKKYQSTFLGTDSGETMLGELFPFSSKSLNDNDWLQFFGTTKNEYWEKYSEQRIQLLTEKIKEFKPKLVVFYSESFNKQWMKIIESLKAQLVEINNNNLPLTLFSNDSTLFCIVPHPVSIKMNGKVKYEIGRVLNELKKIQITKNCMDRRKPY